MERQVPENFETAKRAAEAWDARRVLVWGFSHYRPQIAIGSSFGLEDVVLIDIANRLEPQFSVFTLDTDFLFPQTYELIERIETRYGIIVERLHPELSSAEQAAKHGASLWQRDPDLCCELRKVQPLKPKH